MAATQLPVTRPHRQARLAVSLAFLANGLGFANWAARIPAVKDDVGLSTGALGVALLGIALGAVVAMPLAAVLLAGGLYATRRLLPGGADRDQATPRFVRPTRTLALLGAIAFCGLLSEG